MVRIPLFSRSGFRASIGLNKRGKPYISGSYRTRNAKVSVKHNPLSKRTTVKSRLSL